jgi:spore germination protein GerM
MTRRTLVVTLIVLAVVIASFSYLRSLAWRIFHEIQGGEEAVHARLSQEALQPSTGLKQSATLYFPADDESGLVAETREMSWAATDPDRIRQVLLALIEGPSQGHHRSLPPSTDIRAVFLTADGTAYIDFSNDILKGFAPGIQSETLTVYSVVNSLAANIPAVKEVKILLQGQEVETLDGHVDLSEFFVPNPNPGGRPN